MKVDVCLPWKLLNQETDFWHEIHTPVGEVTNLHVTVQKNALIF